MPLTIEVAYQITFGILWVIYFGTRLFFQSRIKSGQRYTRIYEKQEKLLFRLFALAFLLLPFYFLTPWINFASLPLAAWLRWSGGAGTALGIAFFGWAHHALGQNWTAVLALSEKHAFVNSGPYRYIRHPMYAAFFITGIGFALLSANWLVGVVYLGPLGVMYRMRVEKEEKMMIDRFGDTYRVCMKQTGRLWPHL
jgi:protein-S-isoprenylcysteine O-methyltransferase Ste14